MKTKKLILGLGIALTFVLTLIVGVVCRLDSSSRSYGEVTTSASDDEVISIVSKPTTYTFEPEDIVVKDGGSTLNYTYNPDNNQKEGATVAYKYNFINTMNKKTALNLKQLDETDVTVSYAWSSSELDLNSTITTYSRYSIQTLENYGSQVFVYIFVTPANEDVPVEFNQSVVWWYGVPQTIQVINPSTSEKVTSTIVFGQEMNHNSVSNIEIPDGYVAEYYLDEECTIPAESGLNATATQVYVKVVQDISKGNLPADWLAWDSSTSSYYVTTGTSTLPTDLVIPETYNDGSHGEKSVTYIEHAEVAEEMMPRCVLAESSTIFNSIDFGGITYIDEYAFYDYGHGLTTITFGNNLTSIGMSAFTGCEELISVDLSACTNLTTIEFEAFYYCNNLTNVDLSNCTSLTAIDGSAFAGNNLNNIDLSACTSLTTIEFQVFSYCDSLTRVVLPSSLTTIGFDAFYRCINLISVTFEDTEYYWSVNGENITVDDPATNATNLKTNYVGYEWTKTDVKVREVVANLPSDWIAWDSSTNSYYVTAGSSTLPTDLVIPETHNDGTHGEANVIAIGVPEIVNSVTSIGLDYEEDINQEMIDPAESGILRNITTVKLPKTIISIGYEAFFNSIKLTNVDLSNCTVLTTIGERAFSNCSSLTSIVIPANVTSIASSAFSACYALGVVYNLSSLTITAGASTNGYVAYYAGVVITSLDTENKFETIDGVTYYKDSATSYIALGLADTTLTSVTLHTNTTVIRHYAFYYNTSLTSIDLSNCTNLTTIGKRSFDSCSRLTSIDLSNCTSLATIESDAFSNCLSLTSIVIPASVKNIGRHAFSGSGLTSATFKQTSGWYRTQSATSAGSSVTVSNTSNAATYLKSTYRTNFWYNTNAGGSYSDYQ